MYMLLLVYLEYLYQWVLDMAKASPFACLLNLVEWHVDWPLTKIVGLRS